MEPEKTRKALIIVDVQNDFCPGGALAVPEGDQVVPVINKLLVSGGFVGVVFTQDWHPENHCSFVENGGEWPKHCVQNTQGAKLHPALVVPSSLFLPPKWSPLHVRKCFPLHVKKGWKPEEDSYSGFGGDIMLEEFMKNLWDITQVYVCGLATEYCVIDTALDAKEEAGFETFVVIDACRGVNVKKGDVDRAVKEMRRAGIQIVSSKDIL